MAGSGNGVSGLSVAVILGGSILAYSGVKGYSITKTIGQILNGQAPSGAADKPIIQGNGEPDNPAYSGGSANANGLALQNFLLGKGMSKAGTAGWMGNAQLESSMSTTSLNSGEGAIGLFQWEKGRRTALQNYASKHGLTETDINAQLGYLWQELTTTESASLLATYQATNPQTAAKNVDYIFERSAHTQTAAKEAAAQSFYNQMIATVPNVTHVTPGTKGAN